MDESVINLQCWINQLSTSITVFFATVILKLIVINCHQSVEEYRKELIVLLSLYIAHVYKFYVIHFICYFIITLCERQIYINTYWISEISFCLNSIRFYCTHKCILVDFIRNYFKQRVSISLYWIWEISHCSRYITLLI